MKEKWLTFWFMFVAWLCFALVFLITPTIPENPSIIPVMILILILGIFSSIFTGIIFWKEK